MDDKKSRLFEAAKRARNLLTLLRIFLPNIAGQISEAIDELNQAIEENKEDS
jgi:hypothetical protein